MHRYRFTKREQETIIRWDAVLDEVSIFTAYPPAKRRIEKRGYRAYKVSRMQGEEVGWFYKIPYRDLRWSAKPRTPRKPRTRSHEDAKERPVIAPLGSELLEPHEKPMVRAATRHSPNSSGPGRTHRPWILSQP